MGCAILGITWKGFRPHFACFEALGRLSLRKLESQGVKSALPTRGARPLTPRLARSNSKEAFA